jgi:hypothetical protein
VASLGQVQARVRDDIDKDVVARPAQPGPEAGPAQSLQGAPELGLEDDGYGHGQADEGVAKQEVEDSEVKEASQYKCGDEEDGEAPQQGHGRGAPQQ